jgi:hypothetical protein
MKASHKLIAFIIGFAMLFIISRTTNLLSFNSLKFGPNSKMIGFELKTLILILILISSTIKAYLYLLLFAKNKEVQSENRFMTKKSWWIWLITTICLFTYALYLNNQPPVILF